MSSPAPRRLMTVSVATALSLALLGSGVAAAAQTDTPTTGTPTTGTSGAPDLATWCQARVDAEAGFLAEDEERAEAALDTMAASAPDDIASESTTVATLLKKRGERAFDSPRFRRAFSAVNTYVADSCGFTTIDIGAVDYEYTGVPESVPAGNAAITMSNVAPKEEHEMIVVRVGDDVTLSAEELLELPERKSERLITFKGAAFAEPGETETTVINLEPGRYLMACFIPVGGKKKGAPHFTEGMFAEFEVPAS